MNAARLLFAGTPDFALASLQALVEADHVPIGVLTQPDRPAGRGKRMTASPVKEYALENDIPVMQPATLKDPDVVARIADLDPDLIIVGSHGRNGLALLLGSTSTGVLHGAGCDVLAVRVGKDEDEA